MTSTGLANFLLVLARTADPRRSLVAGLIWLVVTLAASFAVAASFWVGEVAREIVVQQHVRRLVLETQQLGSDLGQAVESRSTAVRTAGTAVSPDGLYAYLTTHYPRSSWVAVASDSGIILAGNGRWAPGTRAASSAWFQHATTSEHPWLGTLDSEPESAGSLGDIAMPVRDATGRITAVVAAHLTWPWADHDLQLLSASLDPRGTAQSVLLDEHGIVRVGPRALLDRAWNGTPLEDAARFEAGRGGDESAPRTPHFERLPTGLTVLIARAPLLLEPSGSEKTARTGWQVQLSEPRQQVYQRANALAQRILWIAVTLGAITALTGAVGARHLTNRLRRLTRSAVAAGSNEFARIEIPSGRDEVAHLATAFAQVLDDLRRERRELLNLSSELERRVALRTREVERLAEESRYAAVVRERLKIARDLHDTLAHSMMAMLSEVRLLRKLQLHDPQALGEELARAEEVAHAGLNEARTAITQMRVNVVRDTGLGAALAEGCARFTDRSGLPVEFTSDAAVSSIGDERAEALFRMAEEALRNVERHARATQVRVHLQNVDDTHVRLHIADDGIGFDPQRPRAGHYGLIGLREQAHLIDARLDIDSAPNAGTRVTILSRTRPETL